VHAVPQTAMGWADDHLHLCEFRGALCGDVEDSRPKVRQRMASVGLGAPHCVEGARACPPGGLRRRSRYEQPLEMLADPSDPGVHRAARVCRRRVRPDALDV